MSQQEFHIACCDHCGQHIEFPAEGLGMRVTCPHCSRETVLAADVSAGPAEAAEEITAAELKAAFAGTLPRRRVSVFYQAGLLLVALVMVPLPMAYVAFALGAAWGVYWYAVHAQGIFAGTGASLYLLILKAVLYCGPILGGLVAVFFMFKPIFARSPQRAQPIELNPALHPRLYQFIAHLSDLLRVAMPKRIFLDCQLNASASFRRGWLSVLGRDLVLTLGLPLVTGINTRQFAVVVAHELGHCTQGVAMRLGYLINGIDRWFLRVVYERDTWDEAFDEWADSVEDWRMSFVAACARFAVWLSRRVLLLLMLVGHAASCFLSRHMEYHADACAMGVGGSAGLESMLTRLREQALIQHLAYAALAQIWQKRHLMPESLPEFLDQFEKRLAAGFYEQAHLTLINETAGVFATHPTAAQRIRKARQRAEAGLFALEKPARALFGDFAAASKLVTGRHFRQNLRLAVTPAMLKPVSAFFPGA